MADSDPEYDAGSDDDVQVNGAGSRSMASRPKGRERAAWEAGAARNWELAEGADGDIEGVYAGREEAEKRKKLHKDTTPLQRGIIRHTILMIDLSSAMTEKDLRPTRHLLTMTYTIAFIREYFEQNPISQLGILGMRDGLAIRVSDMSGNPNDHINAIKVLRGTDPKGNPSLQNGLDMARAALYHTPSHGTREVVIILGALLTSDPGDIHDTIKACIKDKIRVSIIGLAAQMHICAEICRKTNQGDENCYNVALDEVHYRELLMGITTPPVVRATDTEAQKRNQAALLMMGFPSRIVEEKATLCACHGNLTRGGYLCSRCKAKVCNLPATCPTCDLTLILSTHLARSYHHLFPLQNWVEVSWDRARQKGSVQCYGCQSPFPALHDTSNGEAQEKTRARVEGASESSRATRTCQAQKLRMDLEQVPDACREHRCWQKTSSKLRFDIITIRTPVNIKHHIRTKDTSLHQQSITRTSKMPAKTLTPKMPTPTKLNLTHLPEEILEEIFSYLTSGCFEFIDRDQDYPPFHCTLFSSINSPAEARGPDRAHFSHYLCNRWRNNNASIHFTYTGNKYYRRQIELERIPGVGNHHMDVCNGAAGLTHRGLNTIKKLGMCACGHCQWKRPVILSHSRKSLTQTARHFFAPLLVCRRFNALLAGRIFSQNVFAFRKSSDLQRFLNRLAQ